jgi:Protein of unknown function (DUF3016)
MLHALTLEGIVMKTVIPSLALASLLLLAAGSAAAGATVAYTHPENYADMPYASRDRDQVFRQLNAHFAMLASRLPAGQELKVEVLDLDLAGQIKPTHGGAYDLRIVRGRADWPRMHLRYTLEAGGQMLVKGDEHLGDLSYTNRINRYPTDDPLRFEKQMIDDWFTQKIMPGQHG